MDPIVRPLYTLTNREYGIFGIEPRDVDGQRIPPDSLGPVEFSMHDEVRDDPEETRPVLTLEEVEPIPGGENDLGPYARLGRSGATGIVRLRVTAGEFVEEIPVKVVASEPGSLNFTAGLPKPEFVEEAPPSPAPPTG